jgi:hypothetical protein
MVDVNNGSFRDYIPERKEVLRGLREKFMTSSKFISITPCLEITGTK